MATTHTTDQQKAHHVHSVCGGSPGRGPAFGRIRPGQGCPRCDELAAGAEPRQLSAHRQAMIDSAAHRAQDEEQTRKEMRRHFASDEHRTGRCSRVCTAFDW